MFYSYKWSFRMFAAIDRKCRTTECSGHSRWKWTVSLNDEHSVIAFCKREKQIFYSTYFKLILKGNYCNKHKVGSGKCPCSVGRKLKCVLMPRCWENGFQLLYQDFWTGACYFIFSNLESKWVEGHWWCKS